MNNQDNGQLWILADQIKLLICFRKKNFSFFDLTNCCIVAVAMEVDTRQQTIVTY
jgi:hypothetical protein